jgi:MFS family permease
MASPLLGRVLLGMQIATVGKQMAAVALVLFTLTVFGSAELTGLVAFMATFPGLVLAPLVGALLDRYSRRRLVVLDLAVLPAALVLISTLSLGDLLPPILLVLIVGLTSLTSPLSDAGMRTLWPLLVPPHLRGRGNALDSNVGSIASMVGPALAGASVQFLGSEWALFVGAVIVATGALVLWTIPEPQVAVASSGHIWRDAWQGMAYVYRNRTLRGLALAYFPVSMAFGLLNIALPVLVLGRLEQSAAVVGTLFAVQGATGLVGATVGGRLIGRHRDWAVLALPPLAIAGAMAIVGVAPSLLVLAASMVAIGAMLSLMVVALFTLRQRAAEPSWWGRAIAVSVAINRLGGPIGSAASGLVVARSTETAFLLGGLAGLVACGLAWYARPRTAQGRAANY